MSFGLASAGRAILVGSRTAGGAHMTDAATPLPCGYQAWIPNRRPFDPRNGTSWEGTGVTPHVHTTDAAALSAAHLHLLRALRERSREPEERTALDQLISRLERESPDPGHPGATRPQR
jgi:C-terminal processing protease CtpA/Prc